MKEEESIYKISRNSAEHLYQVKIEDEEIEDCFLSFEQMCTAVIFFCVCVCFVVVSCFLHKMSVLVHISTFLIRHFCVFRYDLEFLVLSR